MVIPSERSNALRSFIYERIRDHGAVSFRWFMEQALYHPELGYYSQGDLVIGRHGDFYTNVSVGALFGQLMARQFQQVWQLTGQPQGFAIVEQGAHDGQFAEDVLAWVQKESPEFYHDCKYWIVEPSAKRRELQEERLLPQFPHRVRWLSNLEEAGHGSLMGVFFCNELVDAFPVHLVTRLGGEWYENFVEIRKGDLALVCAPPSTEKLTHFIEGLPELPDGTRTEVNLRAHTWIRDVATLLKRGAVFIVDYGFPWSAYYSPDRPQGTLRCYHKHRVNSDPFQLIGETDITSHVEFTSLAKSALEADLQVVGFTDQHHFMVGAGADQFAHLQEHFNPNDDAMTHALRCFQTLMHPETMGLAFQFLVLQKGAPEVNRLSGLEFAGNALQALQMAEQDFS